MKSLSKMTFGIEEEFYIDSLSFRHPVKGGLFEHDVFHPQIELKTKPHNNIEQLFDDLANYRKSLLEYAAENQYGIICSGTHPQWTFDALPKVNTKRNEELNFELQEVLSRLTTCGCHIHFCIYDKEKSIELINALREYIPFLIAISGNSPFYEARDTGYQSFRNILFECVPRAGIPPFFDDYKSYQRFINSLTQGAANDCYSSDNQWWDIRLNPRYNTIEFRMFDSNADIAAIKMHFAICLLLLKLVMSKPLKSPSPDYVLNENRWRACRYGKNASFITADQSASLSVKEYASQLLTKNEALINTLNITPQIDCLRALLESGTGADHQRDVYNNNLNFNDLTDYQYQLFSKL